MYAQNIHRRRLQSKCTTSAEAKSIDEGCCQKEVIKCLDAGIIYPTSGSKWVSPVQCVPKRGRMTVVTSEIHKWIPTKIVTGWRICMDGHSGFNPIFIAPKDQEKMTFTCPYGTYAVKRMPFGLCNAPATCKRYMIATSMTWWKTLLKSSWMISLCLMSHLNCV